MKKIIIIIPVLLFMLACNTRTGPADKGTTSHDGHEHEKATTGLSLNQGYKWKADAATNKNVAAMQMIMQDFTKGSQTNLAAYKALGTELQKGLDTMITECKMKGPEHEALHKWLQPLIGSVAELNKASDPMSAEKIIQAIDKKLDLYPHYFE